MRVIIAGGRDFDDYPAVMRAATMSGFDITEVVSGACGIDKDDADRDGQDAKGADRLGELLAGSLGVRYVRFYAAWKKRGNRAGPNRNAAMAEYADALIAMPGGSGTASMISEARKRGLPVYEYR